MDFFLSGLIFHQCNILTKANVISYNWCLADHKVVVRLLYTDTEVKSSQGNVQTDIETSMKQTRSTPPSPK